jgi:hypothetical protein
VDPDGAGAITGVGVGRGTPLLSVVPGSGVGLEDEQPMAKIATPKSNSRFIEKSFMAPPSRI